MSFQLILSIYTNEILNQRDLAIGNEAWNFEMRR